MPPAIPTGQPTLYVSNLDGTLIRDDLSMTPWARAELVAMLDEGLHFTIATARSISSLTAILGDIPFRLPVVEFNGAFLTDYGTRKHMLVNAIDTGIAEEVYSTILASGLQPFLSTFDGSRDWLSYRGIANDGEKAYYEERIALKDDRLRRVDDLTVPLRQEVVCFTLIAREQELMELAQLLEDRFAAALQKTAGLEGAWLVVFGDDVNDLGMFRIASHAVAMSNARNELKALAHEVIGSNQEDSVVKWLRGQRS
jgi:hydroxymethylpyrimidine pyrophosphatase-like HAD family hydrolase